HYINDLRIKYAIEKLKTSETFRKYTLQSIANEVGFKKAESFSRAFQKNTGLTPKYFMKELDKKYPNL
ncbi:MAG: helix-turn-helix domain-containing protein, partial [Nitrosopumilus sp.]|nr:helix-turn-helix domain-containing protein [Nitrosopumilus sp.]